LLTCFSGFFAAAFYGGYQESMMVRIEMPEEKAYLVKAFVGWACSGFIHPTTPNTLSPESVFYEELWVMGDKLQAPSFCNLVLQFLVHKWRIGKLRPVSIEYVYKHTTKDSPLRRMLVQAVIFWSPTLKKYERNSSKQTRSELKHMIAEGRNLAVDLVNKSILMLHKGVGVDSHSWRTDEFELKSLSSDGHGTVDIDLGAWRVGQPL
jgi:hypothetical protein